MNIVSPRSHLDFETRSAVDLKIVGAARYARHPSTDIICLSYAKHDEEPECLDTRQVYDGAFIPAVNDFLTTGLGYMTAHNAFFEQCVYQYILVERYGYPALDDPRMWDCTMARALACGLPAKLENLAIALGLDTVKDMAGRTAMMKLTKPTGYDPLGDPIFREERDFPELFTATRAYCNTDVVVEMAAEDRLPELSLPERKVWELDQRINRRGVRIDVAAAAKGARLATTLVGPLNKRLEFITGGKVQKATQVAVLKAWLEESEGIAVGDSLDKHAVEDLLKDEAVSATAREALTIRQQVSKTSTKKFETMVAVADPVDNRARGLLQYHGAATGRWAGRLIQPHNFPKGMELEGKLHILNADLKVVTGRLKVLKEKEQAEVIAAMLSDDSEQFAKRYGSQAMGMLGATLRGMLTASEGKVLCFADFSAIEARVLLWLANDQPALELYRQGKSLYIDMAEYIFKREGITKEDQSEYNLGKKIILGCGFQMSGPKFRISCEQDGIIISEDLSNEAVAGYREKHKPVVILWRETQLAALAAIREPGTVHRCAGGRVAYGMDKKREFLVCRLPSGRFLRYYRPSVVMANTPWGERPEIRYWTTDHRGQLAQFKTYGGSLTENYVQAIARDFMVNGMLRTEDAGYENLLTVHDEVGSEASEEEFAFGIKSLAHYIQTMCTIPDWGVGCPIAAEGFVSKRYRK